jgi:outer membrane protein assembly factor BamB
VWATTLRRRAVRVERTSRQVTGEFYAGEFVLPLVLDGQADLWVGAADAGRVWRVDALTSATLGAADAGAGSNAMAAGAGAVWVGSWPDRTVVRLDAQTGEVRSVIPVGGEAADLAFGAGLLWVAVPEVPEAP